jgi:hypothetical protein
MSRIDEISGFNGQNNNRSSVCTFKDEQERLTKCHKIVEFDRVSYEKAINETRRLILQRLNLKFELINFIEKYKVNES